MNQRIYLDNNATTPLDQRVLKEMLQDLGEIPLNPSSAHFFGQKARGLLSQARREIAQYLQVKEREIIFTSGGTESLNLLIRGLSAKKPDGHIITTKIEHACIYKTIEELEATGTKITYLSPGEIGAPNRKAVREAIRPDTKLIVLSAVNSETGVKLDMEGIASLALNSHIPLILDGVALLGKEVFSIPKGVVGMGFSAHKAHGPKGVGFAFLRSPISLSPQLLGGGQERNSRSGTENLAGILGMAKAISLLKEELPQAKQKMETLRHRFENQLQKAFPEIEINGVGERIANTSNLFFPGIEGEVLLALLDQEGIMASHGSACSSGALKPSRILLGMGFSKERAQSSIRFSLSRMTQEEEIEKAIKILTFLLNSRTFS